MFGKEIPQVQRKNNTKGRILFLRNHDFLLVCFKVILNKNMMWLMYKYVSDDKLIYGRIFYGLLIKEMEILT